MTEIVLLFFTMFSFKKFIVFLIDKHLSWHTGPGFSIEGGTRRLIAAYFGIYGRLLCV